LTLLHRRLKGFPSIDHGGSLKHTINDRKYGDTHTTILTHALTAPRSLFKQSIVNYRHTGDKDEHERQLYLLRTNFEMYHRHVEIYEPKFTKAMVPVPPKSLNEGRTTCHGLTFVGTYLCTSLVQGRTFGACALAAMVSMDVSILCSNTGSELNAATRSTPSIYE
jgi:hypothetical protein